MHTSTLIPHFSDCTLILQCTDYTLILIPHSSDCTLMLQHTDSTLIPRSTNSMLILIPHSTDCTPILQCTDYTVTPIPHSTDCTLITLCTDCTLEPPCQRDGCTINSTPELGNQSNSSLWPANLTGLLRHIWRFLVNNITWSFGSPSWSFEPSLAVLLSGVGRLAGSEGCFTFIQPLPVALLQPFLQLFHQHLPTHSANITTQSFSLHHTVISLTIQLSPFPTVISLPYTIVSLTTQLSPFTTQLSPFTKQLSPFPTVVSLCCVALIQFFLSLQISKSF